MELKEEAASAARSTRCRCCYATAAGEFQNYGTATFSQMICDTFSIALSSDVTRAHGVHMCEPCLQRLRDASGFRRLVMTTEQRFQKLLEDSGNDVAVLKLEPIEAERDSDVDYDDYVHIDYDDNKNVEPIGAKGTIKPLEVVKKSKIIDNVKKAMSIAESISKIYRQTGSQLNMDKLRHVYKYVHNLDRKSDFKMKEVVLNRSVEVGTGVPVLKRTIRVPRFKLNHDRPLKIKRTDISVVNLEPRKAEGDSDVADVDYLRIGYDDENENPIRTDAANEPLEVVTKSKIMANVKKAMSIAERMREMYRQTRPHDMCNSLDSKGSDFKMKEVVLKRSVKVGKRATVATRTICVPRFKQDQGRHLKIKRTAFNTNSTNTLGTSISTEKREVRRIIKQNALAILKNTTACPFTYFRGNFRCFYCHEVFYEFAMLRSHTVSKHNDVKQEARKINAFRDMMMVDITFLKCRRCDQDYGDIETIKEHLITAHNVAIDRKHKDDIAAFKLNAKNFKCHLCNEEFHVFRNLAFHLNKHYSNYMCDVCGKSFISWERYKNHENTHVLGHFSCTRCDDVFSTRKERNAHSTAKHRVTRYGCPLCTERFDKYLERTVHMSSAHSITHKFKCSQCPKEYFHKPHLRVHICNKHRRREKKVECGDCGMRFTDKNAMNRHMVSHTGEKSFVCKVCGKKYGRKFSLTEHMRSHNKPSARGRPVNLMI